jgi:hypothetical protein
MYPYDKDRCDSPMPCDGQPFVCPVDPSRICPFQNQVGQRRYEDQFLDGGNESIDGQYYDEDELMRQRPQDVNRIMSLIERQFANYYTELQRNRIPRGVIQNFFRSIVTYVLRDEKNYTGTIEQRTERLFNAYLRGNLNILNILRRFGLMNNRINQIIRDIIRFTLQNMVQVPAGGWRQWEDLGGVLTSGPATASWQANRLDVFGRGQNNALWHIYWDGTRWSQWEDLGGIITSSPAAVSWGRNRIDVFARGQNNALWHIYWDGTRWSAWEDLGGVLTSEPAVASWQGNRLDVFGRGQNNHLWHKYWNGTRWSEWEDLGGILTSAPEAVSWGPNRIDVFGRGQNQSLWHIYWDGTRWSAWEDLGGGPISSAPGAASTGVNRLEVFARGRSNELLFRTWNGARWSGWQPLGGVLTSEPAAVSWGGNRLDVFARGQNNHLWHIWRP